MNLANMNFEINHQALAVAQMLSGMEFNPPDKSNEQDFCIRTWPWYNGRERGVIFSIWQVQYDVPAQYIAVFEHRNHDGICALKWEEPSSLNPPTITSSGHLAYAGTDDKYYNTFSVKYGEIGQMAEWVRLQMQEYAEKTVMKTKKVVSQSE